MYFLSEEDKRLLLRRLLPQARNKGVAEDLRGWNWDKPPLSPIYGIKLGIFEVAGKYCPTGRDIYLRRVLGVKTPPSPRMIEGSLLHKVLCDIIVEAKRVIYNQGSKCLDELKNLPQPDMAEMVKRNNLPADAEGELAQRVNVLWEFEQHRIITRVQEILTRQPYIGTDSLAALALPVTVEQRLDGNFLGMSSHLSADAFVFSEPMMIDIKFGKPQKFHRLATTGYALVMESLYEYPVNVGCVVYVSFQGDKFSIERDFHMVDDELRQWFIEERDEKMRMVDGEIDPGLAEECPSYCACWRECHPE